MRKQWRKYSLLKPFFHYFVIFIFLLYLYSFYCKLNLSIHFRRHKMKAKLTVKNLIILILALCLIAELFIYHKISFLQTTNFTFIVSSLFLIIGLFWAVLHSGAFDFFHFSMKKVTSKLRREELSEETEQVPLSAAVGKGYIFPLKVGFGLLIICLVTLLGYYLF